jgi:hypothetical protein
MQSIGSQSQIEIAIDAINCLPIHVEAIDFWDSPNIDSAKNFEKWQITAQGLLEIASFADDDHKDTILMWASDAFVAIRDFENALECFPTIRISSKSSLSSEKILNIKLELGLPPSARDIMALFGPKLTKFGFQNIEKIEQYLDIQINESSRNEIPLDISNWTADAYRHKCGYNLFNGHPSYIVTSPPAGWHFSYSNIAKTQCISMIRDAENTWREESEIPRVGEGWVAETRLYHEIRTEFANTSVHHHYSPEWLGRQHLDIAIPDMKIAIEYQGLQHDQPVAFFGGEEAFKRTLERDRRKQNLCRRHGWRLLYVREGYSLSQLLSSIKES